MVERWTVSPDAVGSIPTTHPKNQIIFLGTRECGVMAAQEPPKLLDRVRFPTLLPI